MPLNVRRFYTSIFLVVSSFVSFSLAQTVPSVPQPSPQTANPQPTATPIVAPVKTPTAGEIMRDRISKAKAYIAVRNYNAAAYELENIRRETADQSVQAVVNVLLMNSYLEQGDYKKAQDFLNQAYALQKTTKPNATATYIGVASQVVKSARSRAGRYHALGLNPSDRTLPLEAVNDIEKMRETLEMVITQTKDVGKDKTKTEDAMALLEEAANSRGMLARDDYDARHWKDEVADTREQITSSRSMVINAVNDGMPDTLANQPKPTTVASPPANQVASEPGTKPVFQPGAPNSNPAVKPADPTSGSLVQKTVQQSPVNPPPAQQQPANTTSSGPNVQGGNTSANPEAAKTDKKEPTKTVVISNRKPEETTASKTDAPATSGPTAAANGSTPMDVGSLLVYATRQQAPLYPAAAKNMRTTGVVRVDVTIDENGDVAEVQKTSGPPLLQGAAKDKKKKKKFKPFVRDGQPVKATGFVNFSFSL